MCGRQECHVLGCLVSVVPPACGRLGSSHKASRGLLWSSNGSFSWLTGWDCTTVESLRPYHCGVVETVPLWSRWDCTTVESLRLYQCGVVETVPVWSRWDYHCGVVETVPLWSRWDCTTVESLRLYHCGVVETVPLWSRWDCTSVESLRLYQCGVVETTTVESLRLYHCGVVETVPLWSRWDCTTVESLRLYRCGVQISRYHTSPTDRCPAWVTRNVSLGWPVRVGDTVTYTGTCHTCNNVLSHHWQTFYQDPTPASQTCCSHR